MLGSLMSVEGLPAIGDHCVCKIAKRCACRTCYTIDARGTLVCQIHTCNSIFSASVLNWI